MISIVSGVVAAAGGLILFSCAQRTDPDGPFNVDLLPPEIRRAEVLDERRVLVEFDEDVIFKDGDVVPELPVLDTSVDGRTLVVRFGEDQLIGGEYVLRMSVADGSGNVLRFLYAFSGWNPNVPEILINELNPKGSRTTPDCVELRVMTDGNIGGVVLTVGTAGRKKGGMVFPPVEVKRGDLIVVHAKGEGVPEEQDETGDIDVSGGRLAADTARDFWIPDAPGLPGSNGAVCLYGRKDSAVPMDAVLYSARETDLEDEKLGWTSEGFIWAEELGRTGAWTAADGGIPTPGDAVNVNGSTATRSLCRGSAGLDTDGKSDWHTVPGRGQTFGSENTDEVYSP